MKISNDEIELSRYLFTEQMREENMINTGDKLICTSGNDCYVQGEIYTVGEFMNDKCFKLMTGSNDEYWYASIDKEGVHVRFRFNFIKDKYSDARFGRIENKNWVCYKF